MVRTDGGWRIAAAVLLTLVVSLAPTSRARAQACPRVPAGLHCAPLPKDALALGGALQSLDAEGRRRVVRGDYAGAAQAFGCLVEGDPTPESAGNLSVVLREQGNLGDALLVARCAEDLAPPGPTRDRARARREELEHRLGLPSSPRAASSAPGGGLAEPTVLALGFTPGANPPPSSAPDLRQPAAAPGAFRRSGYTTLAAGVVALIAGGVLYALARDRARQFDDEQQRNGYTDRARSLRSQAETLEVSGWIGGGAGIAAAAVGGVLLTF